MSATHQLGWTRRFSYAGITAAILIMILVFGAFTELSQEEAEGIMQQAEAVLGGDITPVTILANNFFASLLMMIPVVGLVAAPWILYNTGLVFAAYLTIQQAPPLLLLLTLMTPFITVYGLLEMLAYGFATSEGVIIIWRAVRRGLRSELKTLPLILAIVGGLLVLAALIEYGILIAFSSVMSI